MSHTCRLWLASALEGLGVEGAVPFSFPALVAFTLSRGGPMAPQINQ